MWSAGSDPAQVYVGHATVGVWVPGTLSSDVHWEPTASAQEGWARALELLAELDAKGRRRGVAVWLSGALARPFMLRPVRGLSSRSEAIQIATALAAEETGLDGPCEVWLEAWAPEKTSLAIAWDTSLRACIETTARERHEKLRALQPWWTRALNEILECAPADARLLAVEEPDVLTLLCGTNGQFESAASYAPKPDNAQTVAVLTRALLAADALPTQGLKASLSIVAEASASAQTGAQAMPFAPKMRRLR